MTETQVGDERDLNRFTETIVADRNCLAAELESSDARLVELTNELLRLRVGIERAQELLRKRAESWSGEETEQVQDVRRQTYRDAALLLESVMSKG